MVTLYGIPNCDTVKKARVWLADRGVAHAFHDYRKDGLDEARLRSWIAELGWEALLNRSGRTLRRRPDAGKEGLDAGRAARLMLPQPAVIRRPLLGLGDRRLVGFKPGAYAAAMPSAG